MVANSGIGIGEAHGGEDHCGEHCPFLNRSDQRCSDKLCLDHITHAFDYCFGDYKACPVYLEQLAERRVRRLCGMLTPPEPSVPDRDRRGSADADVTRSTVFTTGRTTGRPLVQLSVGPSGRQAGAGARAHRYPQHATGASVLPAAPRL
jgi:hypothetical protein